MSVRKPQQLPIGQFVMPRPPTKPPNPHLEPLTSSFGKGDDDDDVMGRTVEVTVTPSPPKTQPHDGHRHHYTAARRYKVKGPVKSPPQEQPLVSFNQQSELGDEPEKKRKKKTLPPSPSSSAHPPPEQTVSFSISSPTTVEENLGSKPSTLTKTLPEDSKHDKDGGVKKNTNNDQNMDAKNNNDLLSLLVAAVPTRVLPRPPPGKPVRVTNPAPGSTHLKPRHNNESNERPLNHALENRRKPRALPVLPSKSTAVADPLDAASTQVVVRKVEQVSSGHVSEAAPTKKYNEALSHPSTSSHGGGTHLPVSTHPNSAPSLGRRPRQLPVPALKTEKGSSTATSKEGMRAPSTPKFRKTSTSKDVPSPNLAASLRLSPYVSGEKKESLVKISKRQRAEIYALNKLMTEYENGQYLLFMSNLRTSRENNGGLSEELDEAFSSDDSD